MLDTRLAYLLDPDHDPVQPSAPAGADERVLFDAYSEALRLGKDASARFRFIMERAEEADELDV